MRGDLADVRLAEQVFAPHYAAPMMCNVACATPLLRSLGGEQIALLAAGDIFELLELASGHGWGVAPGLEQGRGMVGYCDRAALELA